MQRAVGHVNLSGMTGAEVPARAPFVHLVHSGGPLQEAVHLFFWQVDKIVVSFGGMEWLANNPVFIIGLVVAVSSALLTAGVWVGGVNEHRKRVVAFMDEIRDDVKSILAKLD